MLNLGKVGANYQLSWCKNNNTSYSMPYILRTIINQSKQELWFEGLWFSGDGGDWAFLIRWGKKTKKMKKESEQKEWIMEARRSQ